MLQQSSVFRDNEQVRLFTQVLVLTCFQYPKLLVMLVVRAADVVV